ncbi:MAG: hypothetical protein O7A04_02575 [Acidobacteria bacterium]|nr:hypothetical protein [Acidobacteriota bacterium]
MRYRYTSLLAALALLTLAVACEEPKTPVGALSVDPTQIDLAFPHYQALTVKIDMQADLDPGASPLMMVHVLDLSGVVVRTFDHALPQAWVPGENQEYTIELYQSAMAPPLDPGSYQLTMGLFDPELGRWALTTGAEEVQDQEYAVANVEASQGSDSAPRFFFSPSWMATEAGTDVQVLGRRWLRSEGAIRLANIRAAGTVRLDLRIQTPDDQLEDLVLSEGFDDVQLDVATTCGEQTWSFTGLGTHAVEVAVAPDSEAGDGCEIQLTPHYRIVTRRNLNTRSLALDLLAWRPN